MTCCAYSCTHTHTHIQHICLLKKIQILLYAIHNISLSAMYQCAKNAFDWLCLPYHKCGQCSHDWLSTSGIRIVSFLSCTWGARLTVGSLTVCQPLQPQWRLVMLFAVIKFYHFNTRLNNIDLIIFLHSVYVGTPWYILINKISYHRTVA